MESVTPFDFILLALAVYRATLMITEESGPAWIFKHLRWWVKREAPKKAHLDEGITCPWCVSMWFAIIFAVTERFFFHKNFFYDVMTVSMALSGASVIMNQLIKGKK